MMQSSAQLRLVANCFVKKKHCLATKKTLFFLITKPCLFIEFFKLLFGFFGGGGGNRPVVISIPVVSSETTEKCPSQQ